MRHQMRFVVLISKRFNRLTTKDIHVLRHRVLRFLIPRQCNQFVCVLDTQHFQHLPMELRQVINLRGTLGQLNSRLVLHDPLRHRSGVWITDRNYLYRVVVSLLDRPVPTFRGV